MRSGYEYQVRDYLDRNHIDYEYETETFDYESPVRGARCSQCGARVTKPRKYTPDFVVYRSREDRFYIETKGRFPSTDRSKMRDVRKSHPNLDVRLLFQKRSKAQMAELAKWCEKFGFEYAFGTEVPPSWLG